MDSNQEKISPEDTLRRQPSSSPPLKRMLSGVIAHT